MDLRHDALTILKTGLEAASPGRIIEESVKVNGLNLLIGGKEFDLKRYDRIILLGIGKASVPMSKSLTEKLDVDGGAIITSNRGSIDIPGPVEVFYGTHPVPSQTNREAAEKLIAIAEGADESTLVLFLVSGGGSSLFFSPVTGVSTSEMKRVNELLLRSGASIHEINTVRKHLSRVKGGRFAEAVFPGTIVSLILSDVVGDDPGTIASGPTSGDTTTFYDARGVLERYGLWDDVSLSVRKYIEAGIAGNIQESPESDPDNVLNLVIGSNRVALEGGRDAAEGLGYESMILSSEIEGEAREVGVVHAGIAREIAKSGNPLAPPAVVLSGGETTVKDSGAGEDSGGPNREFALGAATKISGLERVLIAGIDTDGVDGSGKSGAIATGSTVERLDQPPDYYFSHHSTQVPFDELGDSIDYGPTGTNVNDMRIIIVDR